MPIFTLVIAFVLSFILELLLSFFRLMSDVGHEPVKVAETRRAPVVAKPSRVFTVPNEKPFQPPKTPEPADQKADNTESDAEFIARLRKINLNGPLKLDDLRELDELYDRIGGYVNPNDLQEVLKLNPRDLTELNKILRTRESDNWAETREMVEFNRREEEITRSLRDIDWKAPISSENVQKLWDLQDLYGFELSPQQLDEVIASKPGSIQEFIERMTEIEEENAYQPPYPPPYMPEGYGLGR